MVIAALCIYYFQIQSSFKIDNIAKFINESTAKATTTEEGFCDIYDDNLIVNVSSEMLDGNMQGSNKAALCTQIEMSANLLKKMMTSTSSIIKNVRVNKTGLLTAEVCYETDELLSIPNQPAIETHSQQKITISRGLFGEFTVKSINAGVSLKKIIYYRVFPQ